MWQSSATSSILLWSLLTTSLQLLLNGHFSCPHGSLRRYLKRVNVGITISQTMTLLLEMKSFINVFQLLRINPVCWPTNNNDTTVHYVQRTKIFCTLKYQYTVVGQLLISGGQIPLIFQLKSRLTNNCRSRYDDQILWIRGVSAIVIQSKNLKKINGSAGINIVMNCRFTNSQRRHYSTSEYF